MFWSGNSGRDIHVLRGISSRDLTHLSLKFMDTGGTAHFADDYLVQVGDISLTFTPLFKGTVQGDDFVGDHNGITVSQTLGTVTVDAATPVNRKNNFIIEVTAKNDGDTDDKALHETIRVHVHGSLSQIWLSPDLLTLRPIDDPGPTIHTLYRFALRAQFDDGLIGDLTDGHEVTWSDAGGHVNPVSGVISLLPSDNIGDKFFVTATLPAILGGASTPIGPTVQIASGFSRESSPPVVSIVAGGGLPNAATVGNAPNVLFLSDGFRSEDESSFDGIIDTFVHHLRNNQLTKPFNLLAGRMNFWKLFIPANQVGGSISSEVATSGIQPYANVVPSAQKPPQDPSAPDPPAQWELPHVLYAVGLPFPGDDLSARTPALLKQEWARLLQTDPSSHIRDEVVDAWKKLANRTLIEQLDNFPGVAIGTAPAASIRDTTVLRLDTERAGNQMLRLICGTLASSDVTLSDGSVAGSLWRDDTFRFHNRDLLVTVSALPGGRAANYPSSFGRHIVIGTDNGGNFPLQAVAGKNSFSLDLSSPATDVGANMCRTLAHELGHSLGLGDEYVEFPLAFTKTSTDAIFANLESQHDAQIQDPAHPGDPTQRVLDGGQIKWLWHRIVAAGVVDGDIAPAPEVGLDGFRIPVEPDVSFRFVKGDELLLRPRTRGAPLQAMAPLDVSNSLIVQEDPQPDSIVVRSLSAISAARYPAGSLIYKPKPAPASVVSGTYPYAEMVAKNIKDAITANRKPLIDSPGPNDQPQIPLLDNDGGRTPVNSVHVSAEDLPRIVGLYIGGDTFVSGIFHPTGQCMMRNNLDAHAEFCAVCRYILVDLIAPEFHPEIDDDYDKVYPLV